MKSSLALSIAAIALYSSTGFAADSKHQHMHALKQQVSDLQSQVDHLEKNSVKTHDSHLTVATGSSFGLGNSYDGSDLLVNASKVHKDWNILKENQIMNKANGSVGEKGPRIQIGGQIDADVSSSSANKTSNGEVMGELDIAAQINDWVTGYANASASTSNQHLTLDQSFVTIGNLDKAPVFASIGKMYIPTGSYSSAMLEHSLPRKLMYGSVPSVIATYAADNGFYSSVFAYNGETQKTKNTKLDQYGVNAGISHQFNSDLTVKASGSYMSNMAYGSDSFIAALGNGAKLQHYVPAVNVNGSVDFRNFTFFHEYVTATKRFNHNDLSQNGHAAKPTASNYELAYHFPIMGKDATAAVGYGQTRDALGLGLPEKQYGTSLAVNVAKNTVVTVSYTRTQDYKHGTANSRNGGSSVATGHKDNILGAEVDVYF